MLSITAVQLFCRSLAAGSLAALLFSVKCCTGHQWRPLRALCSVCDRHGYATGTWQGMPLCLSVSKNQTKRLSSRNPREHPTKASKVSRPWRGNNWRRAAETWNPNDLFGLQALAVLLPSCSSCYFVRWYHSIVLLRSVSLVPFFTLPCFVPSCEILPLSSKSSACFSRQKPCFVEGSSSPSNLTFSGCRQTIFGTRLSIENRCLL